MTEPLLLYVTAPDAACAGRIAKALVEDKLAACVNIHGEMRSVYRWDGDVEESAETPLIVKTTAAQAPAARDRILALHPYDCPCVLALPVERSASAAAFLDWIVEATTA